MDSIEPKKLALIRIYEILHKYSNEEHPLKQSDIANILNRDYNINIERKAIGRNINYLKECGVEIESGKNGSYLISTFEDSELKLLIDGVLASRYINATHSRQLIEKLCGLTNIYFKNQVKNIYSVSDWSKSDNSALFYNIELIDEAIEKGKRITFEYNKFLADKKLHKTRDHEVSPYQLIIKNQRYYLMAKNEKRNDIGYYRVDHITSIEISDSDLTPIRSVKGYENGIDYKKISTSLPYMFSDKPEKIEFLTPEYAIDQIIDWFGRDVKIEKANDKYKVTVISSPSAMKYWAIQYIDNVEVISPLTLREEIKKSLISGIDKYKD